MSDYCVNLLTIVFVYIKNNDESLVIVVVWVDDFLIVSTNDDVLSFLKEELLKHFKVKDLGQHSYFLGIKFEFFDNHIHMKQ